MAHISPIAIHGLGDPGLITFDVSCDLIRGPKTYRLRLAELETYP